MKILFVSSYFPPFIKGGGEISIYWQVKNLTNKKIDIVVLAPRYKDKLKIADENFKRYWYDLPFLLNNVSPIIFLNPFFIIYLTIKIIFVIKKEKINIIHCQDKFSAPSCLLAKIILKLPLLLSLRDYGGICNHGFCLYYSKKSCNLLSFFRRDFLFYYKNYFKNKNFFSFIGQLIVSSIGRINTFLLASLMKKADRFICVSDHVAAIYSTNGYSQKKMITIYNMHPQINLNRIVIPSRIKTIIDLNQNIILYAGKLSLGKGAQILIDIAIETIKKNKDILFIFAGDSYYPVQKKNSKQILYLGKIDHKLLIKIMSQVNSVCIPSIWPEPMSRSVFEAFTLGKPVISSTAGGMKELINNKNGWIFNPTKDSLRKTLNEALKARSKWKNMGIYANNYIQRVEKIHLEKLITEYQNYQ